MSPFQWQVYAPRNVVPWILPAMVKSSVVMYKVRNTKNDDFPQALF
jgi:hypothetical protein